MNDLSICRNENILAINKLLTTVGVKLPDTTELQRQLLASFVFGVLYAAGRERELNPAEIHALSILSLQDSFYYSLEQAADFTDLLIEAASNENVNNVMNAIIHCGIQGYYQFKNENYIALKGNVESILKEVKN